MNISLDWLNQHKPGNTAKFFNLEFLGGPPLSFSCVKNRSSSYDILRET